MPVGILHDPVSFDPVNIVLQLKDSDKGSINEIKNLKVLNQQGNPIQIGDLVHVTKNIKDKPIYRKNQKRVVFVLADPGRKIGGPFLCHDGYFGKLKEH
jgi:multidrug efflux pump subunit AcrB